MIGAGEPGEVTGDSGRRSQGPDLRVGAGGLWEGMWVLSWG